MSHCGTVCICIAPTTPPKMVLSFLLYLVFLSLIHVTADASGLRARSLHRAYFFIPLLLLTLPGLSTPPAYGTVIQRYRDNYKGGCYYLEISRTMSRSLARANQVMQLFSRWKVKVLCFIFFNSTILAIFLETWSLLNANL